MLEIQMLLLHKAEAPRLRSHIRRARLHTKMAMTPHQALLRPVRNPRNPKAMLLSVSEFALTLAEMMRRDQAGSGSWRGEKASSRIGGRKLATFIMVCIDLPGLGGGEGDEIKRNPANPCVYR